MLMCVFALCLTSAFAMSPDMDYDCVSGNQIVDGKSIVLDDVEIMDAGKYVATSEKIEDTVLPCAYPEKEKSVTFKHVIYDRNNIEMAVLYSTVTGVYSDADNYAMITSIDGDFYGDFANSFSYDTELNGDTGTIYIYFNGFSAGSFTYKLYQNGSLQNI